MNETLAFANSLADAAGEIVRRYFRQAFDVSSKSDHSPVTIADRAIEEKLRDMIKKHYPEDGILGEEFGVKTGKNQRIWVLDPIDGTKSFVMGRPTFGTLIALWEGDKPLLGVIDQAIAGERWVGDGAHTTFNGQAVKTRPCLDLAQSCCASTTPAMFSNTGPAYEAFEKNSQMMGWGGDCYMYGLIASGFMDIAVEASLKPYDFAALIPVIEGAGGKICDWQGKPLTLQSSGEVIALGDPALWPAAQKLLQN